MLSGVEGGGEALDICMALQTLVSGREWAHLSPENNRESLKDLGAGEEGRRDHSM